MLTDLQFAWTNYPSIHWMVSIAAGAPFGFALVVIFQGINNYLVDSYTIFSASVLAGTAVLRSLFATAFPLFTNKMYHNLGIHWATMVPACLALIFTPFPFLLCRYGPAIRAKCKYSAEALEYAKQLQSQSNQGRPQESVTSEALPAPEFREERNAEEEPEMEKMTPTDNKSDKDVL